MRNLRSIFFVLVAVTLLTSCRVKNPMGGEEKSEDENVEESGEITANVISVFYFTQTPFNNPDYRQILSGFTGRTFVVTPDSSFGNQATTPMGCFRNDQLPLPEISVTRYLDVGSLNISGPGLSKSFESRTLNDVPFVFNDNLVLEAGNYTLQTSGINGVLEFGELFTVLPRVEEILLESDDGERNLQGVDFPDVMDDPFIKWVGRGHDLIVHAQAPAGTEFVRISIGDNGGLSHTCHFSPGSRYRIPQWVMGELGDNTSDSADGLLVLDLVKKQFHQDQHGFVRQLYIESYTRHIHGKVGETYIGALGLIRVDP